MSCAKERHWLQETDVPKGRIVGQLINTENGLPFQGVKILFERQTKANGTNTFVDTISTDQEGKFQYNIPYTNRVRVVVADTIRYQADTVMVDVTESKDYLIGLKTNPKFGTSQIGVTVVNDNNLSYSNINVALYVKDKATDEYSVVDTLLSDVNGTVLFPNIAFPAFYKVKIAEDNLKYEQDSLEGSLLTKETLNLQLKTKSKFSQGDVLVNGTYFYTNTIAANTNVLISYKSVLDKEFSTPKSIAFDANGKLTLEKFILPGELKISSASGIPFPFVAQTINLTEENINEPLEVELYDVGPRFNSLTPSSNIVNNTLEVLYSGDQIFTMELDSKGNIYATTGPGDIIKITPKGERSVVISGYSSLWGIALVDDNTLYVSENSARHAIYRVDIDPVTGKGTSTLYSGAVGTSGTADGAVAQARYNRPSDLVYDKSRNSLWLGEWQNQRIRKIDLTTNTVSTFQTGKGYYFGISLTADSKYLYLASHTGNSGLYKYDIAANKLYIVKTSLGSTRHVAVAPNNTVYFTTNTGPTLRMLTSETLVEAVSNTTANTGGSVATVAGTVSSSGNSPAVGYKGPANIPIFESTDPGAAGLIYDPFRGRLYIASYSNSKLYFVKLTSSY